MADPGLGGHNHPGAGHLGPPAEVDVGAVVGHGRVEAAELGEQVGTHEQAGRRGGEHVAHRVVLLLVELAPVDQRGARPGLVDRQPHTQQPVFVVPVDQFGGHDAGVGPERLLDHDAEGVGLGGDVVVAEDQERRPLDGVEHVVGRRRKPGRAPPAIGTAQEGVGQHGRNARTGVFAAGAVDDQDRLVRVVLGAHRPQGLFEPLTGLIGHDD